VAARCDCDRCDRYGAWRLRSSSGPSRMYPRAHARAALAARACPHLLYRCRPPLRHTTVTMAWQGPESMHSSPLLRKTHILLRSHGTDFTPECTLLYAGKSPHSPAVPSGRRGRSGVRGAHVLRYPPVPHQICNETLPSVCAQVRKSVWYGSWAGRRSFGAAVRFRSAAGRPAGEARAGDGGAGRPGLRGE